MHALDGASGHALGGVGKEISIYSCNMSLPIEYNISYGFMAPIWLLQRKSLLPNPPNGFGGRPPEPPCPPGK